MPPIPGTSAVPNGLPTPTSPRPRRTSTLTAEEQKEQYAAAVVTFDKTIRGHYRGGKAGYARVGVLFLTWEADDLQCKESEVNALRGLFGEAFKFETYAFEIPSVKCATALTTRLTAFCHEYDSPDCLTIIYYGGHGYPGTETGKFKLAAKVNADADGDPTVFFQDIEQCLRGPECDQLVILDCCYSSRAFARDHIGKRKFELITSAAHNVQSDAPRLPGSFTQNLHQTLGRLLEENPRGFCTTQLYREIYHQIPEKKPFLFDQSRRSYGRIWLRPLIPVPKTEIDEERTYLKLTLKLDQQPEGAIMNELASNLQFLPHVSEIKVEKLYAPRRKIEDFMLFVVRTQKLRPLMRRIYARRQLSKPRLSGHFEDKEVPTPPKLVEMQLSRKHEALYDWSSARESPAHKRQKSSSWPSARPDAAGNSAVTD